METKRKLVTIRTVKDVLPIEKADSLELVLVDGWQVVAKKGEFKPGDRCVYFEIDSFLPVHPAFEFLRASSYKRLPELGEGFRLKTIKLRGQLSQGLVLPLNILDQFGSYQDSVENDPHDFGYLNDQAFYSLYHKDTDFSDYVGVKLFQPPVPAALAGQVRGLFPSFMPKTDQERVQNLDLETPEKTITYTDGQGVEHTKQINKRGESIHDFTYEVTLKLDGSSMTVYRKDGYVGVCSRNMDLTETPDNAYWKAARESGLIDYLNDDNQYDKSEDIAFQGELMGPGVQGNRENLKKLTFFLFDVYHITTQTYYTPLMRQMFFSNLKNINRLNIEHVPVLDIKWSPETYGQELLAQLLEKADIPSLNHKVAEGIVFKANESDFSFKVINNRYLLDEK